MFRWTLKATRKKKKRKIFNNDVHFRMRQKIYKWRKTEGLHPLLIAQSRDKLKIFRYVVVAVVNAQFVYVCNYRGGNWNELNEICIPTLFPSFWISWLMVIFSSLKEKPTQIVIGVHETLSINNIFKYFAYFFVLVLRFFFFLFFFSFFLLTLFYKSHHIIWFKEFMLFCIYKMNDSVFIITEYWINWMSSKEFLLTTYLNGAQ